ncbi:hypothetical protein M9Q43_06010 [Flavobacterium sp. HXWNR29]|uniref:hypothetical protein n=1 Tax=Flavobacterium odoriferum TaxID=2946604 RepID=UPI0021CB6153|nr:hypothetical protein [Flavobacterium sp. HXWNR29]MCU4188719.1 hypothetical protein [Flavobacterium sp. HXWNR29]
MAIRNYYNDINKSAQEIFLNTIEEKDKLGYCHHISAFFFEFSECIQDKNEKNMMRTVSIQLDTATINVTYGLYRQAISSLRLAFELALGVIHFSVNKLEHAEWILGKNDIKWSKLIDEENGVLSVRFCNAFFHELNIHSHSYNSQAKELYREMSEYVHGNNDTWSKSGLSLKFNETLLNEYFSLFKKITEIMIFLICCRYLKSFERKQLDQLSTFLLEEMNHISAIREILGGVKE